MLELATTAFVTLFVIFDPPGNVPVFLSITPHAKPDERRRIALRATLIAAVVLTVFGIAGEQFMKALGISLPAFRIAGGILLLLLSIEMVFARHSGLRTTTAGEEEEATHRPDVAVFPLAVPLIAGPGALASMLLLMAQAGGTPWGRIAVVAAMLAALGFAFAVLVAGARVLERVGVTGINVLTRIFGVVLSALAVQFVIDGAREAFRF
jgi:multiple antibiotic resistance protein